MTELAFPVAAKLIERLGSIASEEICLAWGIKADLQKLRRTMSTIKDVLLDAEEKQARNNDLRSWLRELKDVFLDAEDLLDEFECEALRRQVARGSGTTRKVRRFFSRSNPVAFRLRLGHGIKDIRERLHELKDDKNFADLRPVDLGDHVRENRNTTHSFVRASEVIGRETEKNEVVDLLMVQGGDNGNVSVIPIVGLPGLGKTTLAKLVYNNEKVVGGFELRMWLNVSVDFDITRLAKEILGSALGTEISERLSLDRLQERLRNALKDKKFLLVLDDVWNEDRIKWSELRDLLVEGAKVGTKILVTTRNISVASIMGTVGNINLDILSFEDCLSLFVKCAFKEGQERQHPSLYEMGKDIVRKCGGVPLAVKTLGSQLYSKTDERQWKLIRDSEIWELEREGAGQILPALRLSYTQLPYHLKQCLACCSILQKKYDQFDSRELINNWMAFGVLEYRDHANMELLADMELEDVGELYFKALWERSFFQNVKDFIFNYKFQMHDLIHDLVQSVAQGESFIVGSAGTKVVTGNVRHLSVLEIDQNDLTTLQKMNKVRTITTRRCENIDESFLRTCISRFRYLRVLKLANTSLELLPSSIGSLKHLRTLNFCGNEGITEVPNSICKLQSLKTLNLGGCVNLEELPRGMSKLISLRYLDFTTKQSSFPENGVGCLKSLRYLVIMQCSNLTCLPRDTSYLASLRTLRIGNCQQLDLVMENYQVIPLKLKKLGIAGVPRMVALPEWFQGATDTLQDLVIRNCQNLEALPGWLTSFTSLRRLILVSCPKLLSLPEEMQRLTALTEVRIRNCPDLERRCQRDTGEDWPKISHIPNVFL